MISTCSSCGGLLSRLRWIAHGSSKNRALWNVRMVPSCATPGGTTLRPPDQPAMKYGSTRPVAVRGSAPNPHRNDRTMDASRGQVLARESRLNEGGAVRFRRRRQTSRRCAIRNTRTRRTSSSMRQSPTRYRHSGIVPGPLPELLSGAPKARGSSIAPTRSRRNRVIPPCVPEIVRQSRERHGQSLPGSRLSCEAVPCGSNPGRARPLSPGSGGPPACTAPTSTPSA